MFKSATFSTLKNEFLKSYKSERDNDNGNLSKMRLDKRKEYFDYIKGVNIDKKRNMVVHSSARRPSLKDVGSYEKLANAVIWLGQYLEIEDSIDIQNDRLTY